MKTKWMMAVLTLAFLLMVGAQGAAAAETKQSPLQLMMNGKSLKLGQIYEHNGSILVPYRALAQTLGASVNWDAKLNRVTVKKGSTEVGLRIGSQTASVNGVDVQIDVPALLVKGSTYVPLRFVSETFGLNVAFDGKAKTVTLAAPTAPGFKVFGVKEGDLLNTNHLTISIAVFQHELKDFRTNQSPSAGQGHIHVWLDTDPSDPKIAYKQIDGKPIEFDKVKPGHHMLTVQLVGNDHKPIQPAVKQTIMFGTTDTSGKPDSTGSTPNKPAEDPKGKPESKTYTVDLENFAFSSKKLEIEAGATVIFTNKDDAVHTVTAEDKSFDSGDMNKGDTFKVTFDKAGEFPIYCKPHASFMKAVIVVK